MRIHVRRKNNAVARRNRGWRYWDADVSVGGGAGLQRGSFLSLEKRDGGIDGWRSDGKEKEWVIILYFFSLMLSSV
jgi:hypothetical protein